MMDSAAASGASSHSAAQPCSRHLICGPRYSVSIAFPLSDGRFAFYLLCTTILKSLKKYRIDAHLGTAFPLHPTFFICTVQLYTLRRNIISIIRIAVKTCFNQLIGFIESIWKAKIYNTNKSNRTYKTKITLFTRTRRQYRSSVGGWRRCCCDNVWVQTILLCYKSMVAC